MKTYLCKSSLRPRFIQVRSADVSAGGPGSTMGRMTTLTAGLRSQLMVLRETALAWADTLAALAAGFSRQSRILREAAFFVRHAFTALSGYRALFFRVHRRKASCRRLVGEFVNCGHASSLIICAHTLGCTCQRDAAMKVPLAQVTQPEVGAWRRSKALFNETGPTTAAQTPVARDQCAEPTKVGALLSFNVLTIGLERFHSIATIMS